MPVSNPAFAFLVTSPIAKGTITGIELREAKAVPGVLEIFTHENTGELKPVKYGGGRRRRDHLDPGLRPENPA